MTAPPVSVIVVSRERPQALIRCLTGISQLRYAPVEVIVVSDDAGLDAVRRWPPGRDVKAVACDQANISAARNLGLRHAAGDLVAFIDDDAVPEPGWLQNLGAAFQEPAVGAAGGYVIGRNGLSWQWRAQSVDGLGCTQPIQVTGDRPVALTPPEGAAIKTEGTNMMFRRASLANLGGFDRNFRYFLDETDVNLRLADQGISTAIVPRAVVHHGFAPSAVRRPDRVPRDLSEIGASWAVFLRKHAAPNQIAARWRDIAAQERRRLLTHMVAGRLEPRDLRRLLTGLQRGYQTGLERPREDLETFADPAPDFRPFPTVPQRDRLVLSGNIWARHRLRREAEEAVRAGRDTTIYLMSRTALFHQRRFVASGYWEQRGGLFGKSLRSDPLFRFWRLGKRVEREEQLWSSYR